MNNNGFPVWDQERAKRYKELGLWEDETFGEMLQRQAEAIPEQVALTWRGSHLTYEELHTRAYIAGHKLRGLGIQPGDHVLVQLPNSIAFFEVIFALFKIGALPVFCLPAHRFTEVSYIAEHTKAVAYIVSTDSSAFDYKALAEKVKTECRALNHVLGVDNKDGLESSDITITNEASKWPTVEADSYAFLQLSGGSTGLPKLIPRTHNDYAYSIRRSNEICGITEKSVYLTALPIAHNYPLSSPGVIGLLMAGGRIVLAETGAPDETFPLIEREGVTITGLVPPLALVWLEAVKHRNDDLSSLEVLQVGGAKCSSEVAKRFGPAFGCTLQQVFGMAEGLVNYTRLDDTDDRIFYTQGKPMCEYDEVQIVDENGRVLGPNQTGELWTRGPYTIPGYFKAEDHNQRAFSGEGFYKTGDLASIRSDGYIVVEGRMKDQINRGGEKVAAEEVENQFLAHDAIFDVALVALPDAYLGERVCAYIILKKNAALSAQEAKSFLRKRGIAAYKVPDVIEFVDAFPATGVGKVSKQELRQAIVRKALENKNEKDVSR